MNYFTEQAPGRIVQVEDREFLYFGGTSYLGLQTDPEFRALMLDCIKNYGSSHGASRISNLRLNIYQQAEAQLATWVGSEAALTLSSGFLAGQMLAYFFHNKNFKVYYSPGTHPAVLPGGIKPLTSLDLTVAAIKEDLSSVNGITPVLFMDGVDLTGSSYPSFKLLKQLPLNKIIVVADDSHGLGIVGATGGGNFKTISAMGPKELIICSSLGKALGVQGGAIFGSANRLKEIWDTPFFSGASPAPPGHMAALLSASQSIYHIKRNQLARNIKTFEALCPRLKSFRYLPQYPVFAYNNHQLTNYLEAEGILVTDFAYASLPVDSYTGRIVVSAHHKEDDIIRLAGVLKAFPDKPVV